MNEKKKSTLSDLQKIDNLSDEQIDYSDIPALDDAFFTKTLVILPRNKDSITLRVDHDVLEFFKQQGKGYQTLMNAVLKMYVQSKRKAKG